MVVVVMPHVPSLFTGMEDYLKRYREGMRRVLTAFGPVPEFSGEAAKRITEVSFTS